jgi:hypothetical protein
MTQLSKDRFLGIDKSPRADFHFKLIGFLREQLPEETGRMDDVALLQRITESEQRASAYGVRSEAGVGQWTCLTFLAGPRFDEMPEVREYLEEPEPDGEQKVAQLVENLEREFQSS